MFLKRPKDGERDPNGKNGPYRALIRKALEAENSLASYEKQFNALPDEIRQGFVWESISQFPVNIAKFPSALRMQGGGQVFDVSAEGELFFKDFGSEPVMYGFDKNGYLMTIYDRDPEKMKLIEKWADSIEIREAVRVAGYRLFEEDGDCNFTEFMKRAAAVNDDGFFVSSKNHEEWRASALLRDSTYAGLFPPRMCYIYKQSRYHRDSNYGVIRWI